MNRISALTHDAPGLSGPPDDEAQPKRHREPREPREYGLYTGACLRWNPVTRCAEPGTFTVHEEDFIGGAK